MPRSLFKPAAGVVVLRYIDGDWNVLCLKTFDGKYDLTKGIIDPGEDEFDAALRETREEAGISEIEFPFGRTPLRYDACTMYVGVTNQEPEIVPNPHSGILEHAGYSWVPIIDAVNSEKIKKFLQPAVDYAHELIIHHRDKQPV